MNRALVWFRRDLRLADHPALTRARATCERLFPVFLWAPEEEGAWPEGAAARWWRHHSLTALDKALRARGSRLIRRDGPSLEGLRALIRETGATHVFWNRLYEPAARARDQRVQQALRADGVVAESLSDGLWFEPGERLKRDRTPFQVFTPFWKACLKAGLAVASREPPAALPAVPDTLPSQDLRAWKLCPKIPWDVGLAAAWTPGEAAAGRALDSFCAGALATYGEDRDLPGRPGSSRLSPHLHFGEISPRQISARLAGLPGIDPAQKAAFLRELGWREFAYHLLVHFPHTPETPLDGRFEAFPWATDGSEALDRWQRGCTGFPLVDAGLRELWQSGWMPNRARLVAASLLTKNLLLPWPEGARWFWDTLVDADLAVNTLNWQWVAGCGADAAPYFRIFNPVLQGRRFDPRGDYTRRWVPELKPLPDRWLQEPGQAPASVLEDAGFRPGRDYPPPMVDLSASRARALEIYRRHLAGRRAGAPEPRPVRRGNRRRPPVQKG